MDSAAWSKIHSFGRQDAELHVAFFSWVGEPPHMDEWMSGFRFDCTASEAAGAVELARRHLPAEGWGRNWTSAEGDYWEDVWARRWGPLD
jgi:hypothetical protein